MLKTTKWLIGLLTIGLLVCTAKFVFATSTANLLITERYNERVIKVDPITHDVLWQYGQTDVAGSGTNQLNHPFEAVNLINGNILIADTDNHRVIEVQPSGTSGGTIIWQYGQTGVFGSGTNQLNFPFDVMMLNNGNILITDYGIRRTIEVQPTYPIGGNIVWQKYSPDGYYVESERLPDGSTLLTSDSSHEVIRITGSPSTTIWYYGQYGSPGSGTNQLNLPRDAIQLVNGNILITDSGNHRVIEVQPTGTSGGTIVWQYGQTGVSGSGVNQLYFPHEAIRLANGNTMIADRGNYRVIEVKTDDYPHWTSSSIVWQQGQTGVSGSGWNQLGDPCDVEEIWQGVLNQVIVTYKNMTNVPQPVVTAWVFTPVIPPIVEPPVLEVTKMVHPVGTQSSGTELTYTIAYTNTGQGTATNVVFTDGVPAGTNFVSGSAIGAGATITYSVNGTTYLPEETTPVNYIRWTFGNIGPGVSGTLQFKVIIQ